MRLAMVAIGMLAVAGGASAQRQESDNWRTLATPRDEAKVANLQRAWVRGLAEARRADPALLRQLGVLVRPGAALARPHPGPGIYRCRTVKLGSKADSTPRLVAYGWFRCDVELTTGGDLWLRKTTGSQRPAGLLYPLAARRLAFVGTLALSSSETGWPRYGVDADRDMAGILERIGANHYRLVLPEPEYESEIDILELKR